MFEEKVNGRCPIETTIQLLSGKYKTSILWALKDDALRYGEIQAYISQASPKMLAEQLKEMQDDNLISKTVYPTVPPKTEYRLTEYGKNTILLIKMMEEFGRNYLEKNTLL